MGRIASLVGRTGVTQRATRMNHSFLICGSMLRPVALWQTRLLSETPVAIGSGRFHFEGRWPPFPGSGAIGSALVGAVWHCMSHLGGPARIDLWCPSLRPARCLFPPTKHQRDLRAPLRCRRERGYQFGKAMIALTAVCALTAAALWGSVGRPGDLLTGSRQSCRA